MIILHHRKCIKFICVGNLWPFSSKTRHIDVLNVLIQGFSTNWINSEFTLKLGTEYSDNPIYRTTYNCATFFKYLFLLFKNWELVGLSINFNLTTLDSFLFTFVYENTNLYNLCLFWQKIGFGSWLNTQWHDWIHDVTYGGTHDDDGTHWYMIQHMEYMMQHIM